MKITPLAFDSFSVRSMATLVEIGSKKVLLDPGIAVGPRRFGVEPSREEIIALDRDRRAIIKALGDVDIITISHYHFDHHPYYDDLEFNEAAYTGKVVLAKDFRNNITAGQKRRHAVFQRVAEPLAREISYVDGRDLNFEGVRFSFSKAVPHGSHDKGHVLMTTVSRKEKLMHCSDIHGCVDDETADIIIANNPDYIIMGGPPTYLLGTRFSKDDLEKAVANINNILDKSKVKKLVLDHHLLRDLRYKKYVWKLFDDSRVMTAAEFVGREDMQLEARRKEFLE